MGFRERGSSLDCGSREVDHPICTKELRSPGIQVLLELSLIETNRAVKHRLAEQGMIPHLQSGENGRRLLTQNLSLSKAEGTGDLR